MSPLGIIDAVHCVHRAAVGAVDLVALCFVPTVVVAVVAFVRQRRTWPR